MREGCVSSNKSSIQHVQVQRKSAVSVMQFPVGSNETLLPPEEPKFSSVALMSPSTVLRDRIELPSHRGLERLPSLKKASVNYGENSAYIPESQRLDFDKIDKIKSNHNRKDQGSNWNVVNGSLKCVPDHYILERTSRFIGDTTASVISARISGCLRARSIETSFNSDKAKVKCRAMDHVKFIVRLYSGRGAYNHGVIVEIQKRSGSGPGFMKDCTAILDAAEVSCSKKPVSQKPLCPASELKCIKDILSKPQLSIQLPVVTDVTENPFGLVMENRLDANILGMDSLCNLTDVKYSAIDIAVNVAKRIFSSDNQEITEKILSMIRDNGCLMDEDDLDIQSPISSKLRNLALTLMVNILNLTKIDTNLISIIKSQSVFNEDFVLVLVGCLKNAQGCSVEASIAAKGLNILLSSTFALDTKNKLHHIGGLDVLHQANSHGSQYHSLLSKETESCLNALSA